METNTCTYKYLFTHDHDKQPDIATVHQRGKQFKWLQMDLEVLYLTAGIFTVKACTG